MVQQRELVPSRIGSVSRLENQSKRRIGNRFRSSQDRHIRALGKPSSIDGPVLRQLPGSECGEAQEVL